MEGFITVIVWVIVAISVIARQVKRSREAQPQGTEQPSGKTGGLLEELKRQLQDMVEESAPSPPVPAAPQPVVTPKKSKAVQKKPVAPVHPVKRHSRLDSMGESSQPSRAVAAYRQSDRADELPFNAYDHEHHEESLMEVPVLSADTLRDAVILSEILGKPRALRAFPE